MTEQSGPPTFSFFSTAIIWIVLLAGTTLLFNSVLDRFNNPNQKLEISVNANGNPEVVLKQNRYGHYVANGTINGQKVEFLLDTGATNVAIPEHIANKLNLKKGAAHQTMTANGTSKSFQTTLASISLGDIVMHNVPASISSGMKFDEILLGMSFLKHLKLTQQGKLLTLSLPKQDNL